MTDAAQLSSNEEPYAGETGGNAEHQGHVLPGDRQKQINDLKKCFLFIYSKRHLIILPRWARLI